MLSHIDSDPLQRIPTCVSVASQECLSDCTRRPSAYHPLNETQGIRQGFGRRIRPQWQHKQPVLVSSTCDQAVVHVPLVLLLTLPSRCVLVLMHHNVDPHPGVDAAFPVGHAER